jgi:hypothetical protein
MTPPKSPVSSRYGSVSLQHQRADAKAVGSKCSGREAEQGGGGACQGEGRALGWWHIKAMRRRHRRGRLTSRRRRSQQASEGA